MTLVITAERQYANGNCQVWMRCACGCCTVRLSRMPIKSRDKTVALVMDAHRCTAQIREETT